MDAIQFPNLKDHHLLVPSKDLSETRIIANLYCDTKPRTRSNLMWIISQKIAHHVFSTARKMKQNFKTENSIPLIFSWNIDPVELLEQVLASLFFQHCYLHATTTYDRIRSQAMFFNWLISCPPASFECMKAIFLDEENRQRFIRSQYQILPPPSVPCTESASLLAVHQALQTILSHEKWPLQLWRFTLQAFPISIDPDMTIFNVQLFLGKLVWKNSDTKEAIIHLRNKNLEDMAAMDPNDKPSFQFLINQFLHATHTLMPHSPYYFDHPLFAETAQIAHKKLSNDFKLSPISVEKKTMMYIPTCETMRLLTRRFYGPIGNKMAL